MKRKIDTPEGRKTYSRRLGVLEPVFANLRAQKSLDRFTLRGPEKVNIQWKLYCLVHNLEKLACPTRRNPTALRKIPKNQPTKQRSKNLPSHALRTGNKNTFPIVSTGKNMKTKPKTDWEARFACEKPITIKTIEKSFADIPAGSRMLIVTPKMVDEEIRKLPKGSIVQQLEIRKSLSKRYKSDYACPVTTGIALRVVSECAYIQIRTGVSDSEVTPFWRVVDPNSDLAEKLSCGKKFISQKRKDEKIEA